MALTNEERYARARRRLEYQEQGLLPRTAKGGKQYYLKRYSDQYIYDTEGNLIEKRRINIGKETRKQLKRYSQDLQRRLFHEGYEWVGDSFDFLDRFKTKLLDLTMRGDAETRVDYEVYLNSTGWDDESINRILVNEDLDWFMEYFVDSLIGEERTTTRYESDVLRNLNDEMYSYRDELEYW